MGCYVVCPNRESRKVSLEVCLRACELKHECDEFKEVPRADMEAAAKKLGIPLQSLRELESVIDVEIEVRTDEAVSGAGDCGKNSGSSGNNSDCSPEGANVSCGTPLIVELPGPDYDRTKNAMELYEKLLNLKNDIGAKFIEMGELLNQFYDHKYYLEVGYQDWEQFCAEALDFHARWALDIRKIAIKKEQLKLSDRDVAEIGVKKMAQLLPVMRDRRSADHWIKEAKKPGVTTERLIAKVRQARGRITKEEAEKVPVKYILPVYEDDVETVERAFELAKEVTQSDSRGVQFVAMAEEFRSTYEHESGDFDKHRIVAGMLKRIESLMKVKISGDVTDAETGEVIREGEAR